MYPKLDEGQIRVLLADEKTRNSRYQIIKRGITVEEKQAFDKYKSASSDTSLSESARAERSNTRGIWFEEEYIRTYLHSHLDILREKLSAEESARLTEAVKTIVDILRDLRSRQ